LSSFGKRQQGISEKKNIRDFFGFKSTVQNCFWNLFITSGLSQICIIRNACKLPSPISWLSLILFSEKTSWSLKTSFWISNKLKNSHENFSGVRVSIVLGLLAWIS
jgi:hypothetical protein